MSIDKALEVLGLDENTTITAQEIFKAFKQKVYKSHPDSCEFQGKKFDMDDLVKAKKCLLENLSGITREQLKGMEFEQAYEFGLKEIKRLKEQGCDESDIILIFGIDYLADIARFLCEELKSLDFELYTDDRDEYWKLSEIVSHRIELFKDLGRQLKIELKLFLELMGKAELQSYGYICYQRDYNYGSGGITSAVSNFVKSIIVSLNTFDIEFPYTFALEYYQDSEHNCFFSMDFQKKLIDKLTKKSKQECNK